MRYLTAIRSGVSIEVLSRKFAQELVTASDNTGELSLPFTCDFVNDTLLSIGLPCKLRPEHIIAADYGSLWNREQIQQYIFNCNESDFKCVEQFLVIMSRSFAFIRPDCYAGLFATSGDGTREFETPVEYFMQMIAVWCVVYKQLLKEGDLGPTNMFVEPLARISLQLFSGIHDLRLAFSQYFPLLNNICSNLFRTALQGLRFPKIHTSTLNTLLQIVSSDYDSFPEDTVVFLQEALMIESDTPSDLIVLTTLRNMLQDSSTYRLNVLTNILLKSDVMELCYHILVSKKGKSIVKQQQEVLQFLDVLQSKLLALDCFTRKYMEAILNLVPHKRCTSPTACKLYIDIMKHKLPDEGILAHLLEFYVSYVNNTSQLSFYVLQFYNHFDYMQNVYNFLDIILWPNSSQALQLLCAHVVVSILKIKFANNEYSVTFYNEVESLLLILPQILEEVTCQPTIGILLQLLQFVPFDVLQKQTLDNIVHYAIGVLKNLKNNYEYPLLMNIFLIIKNCVQVVQEWHHLELLGNYLIIEYTQSIQKLERLKAQRDQNSELDSVWKHLCDILKRINIIVKTGFEIIVDLPELVSSLNKHILSIGQDNLCQTSNFIDVYALEIVTSSIIKLLKEETIETIYNCFAFEKCQMILAHMENYVKDWKQFLKLPEFRLKAYFSSLLNIYIHLPLKISNKIYYRVTHILIALVLDSKHRNVQRGIVEENQHVHPKQKIQYVRLMLRHFTELHKYDHIELTSNVVWKLCIFFGMPGCKYNDELKDLLITLGNYRFKTYKHIIAVLVYNIHRRRPLLSCFTINLLLRKHKDVIDNELTAESLHLLKLHIVLLVLQIVEKSLNFRSINERFNRLDALKYLKIFLEDCCNTAAKQNLMDQVDNLKIRLLTAGERKLLNRFIQQVKKL